MSLHPDDSARLVSFERHLASGAFTRSVIAHHLDRVEQFLGYLRSLGLRPEGVTESQLEQFIKIQRQRFRRRHGFSPQASWYRQQATGIHRFLSLTQGRWPPRPPIDGDEGGDAQRLLDDYQQYLGTQRELAETTVMGHVDEARRFITSLPGPHRIPRLAQLSLVMIDRYLRQRTAGLQRATARGTCHSLRRLMRYLHGRGLMPRDLSSGILAPTRYRGEGIPSAIPPEQVDALLAATRRDRTRCGRRDFAILMLLATYGMRAAEIRLLRLEDIDWRGERLTIRHSKTGKTSCLPLMPGVGHALLDYLRQGRPPSEAREVFLRVVPPRGPFVTSSALNSLIHSRLVSAGITLNGRRGPHAFRHARAVSLQRAGVSLKTIGDLLGHRAFSSTAEYLKLAEPELRSIALPMPRVSP
jgi:site-specific recombinase XerD